MTLSVLPLSLFSLSAVLGISTITGLTFLSVERCPSLPSARAYVAFICRPSEPLRSLSS